MRRTRDRGHDEMAATLTPERAHEDQSDTDLVAAVRAGDDAAFAALYSRYHAAIVRFAHGMTRDWARAEDVTPGRLHLRAAPHARDGPSDHLPPLGLRDRPQRVHRSVPPRQARRGAPDRRATPCARASGPSSPIAAPCPSARPRSGEQMDHLRGAFGGLSDNHHRILVLREFEGLSYHEIGERMGLTRPSVESTLFRARRRLGRGVRRRPDRPSLRRRARGARPRGRRHRRRPRAPPRPASPRLVLVLSQRRAPRRPREGRPARRRRCPRRRAAATSGTSPIVFDPAASWFKATAAALGLAAASTGASLAVYAVPDKPLHKPLAPHSAVQARSAHDASLDHARRAVRTRAAQRSAARGRAGAPGGVPAARAGQRHRRPRPGRGAAPRARAPAGHGSPSHRQPAPARPDRRPAASRPRGRRRPRRPARSPPRARRARPSPFAPSSTRSVACSAACRPEPAPR